MSQPYTYTKTPVALDRLAQEISNSLIGPAEDRNKTNTMGDQLSIYFKADILAAEKTILDAIVTAHSGVPLVAPPPPTNAQGAPQVEAVIRLGSPGWKPVSIVTPDFTDRCSWYQNSVHVVADSLTDSGDGLTFTSSHPYWINLNDLSGTSTYSYAQVPKRSGGFGKHTDWAFSVSVNGTVLPQVVSGVTQYSINFATGVVTFTASQTGNTVTASYWTNDGVALPSEWILTPPAGKKFVVESVELQFGTGVVITNPIRMEIWAGKTAGSPPAANIAGYYNFPDAMFDPGGVFPAGYGQFRADYRNARDIMNAGNGGTGQTPALDGLDACCIINFNYVQAFLLDSAQGALFRIRLLQDLPITGTNICTAAFYVVIQSD